VQGQAAVSFPSANNRQTNMASSDTDDDVIITSFLIASTMYLRRQVNVGKCKRNSWPRKQTIDHSQLGNRVRNCQRIEMVSI